MPISIPRRLRSAPAGRFGPLGVDRHEVEAGGDPAVAKKLELVRAEGELLPGAREALGVLVAEGLLYGGFPQAAKRLAETVTGMPETRLRMIGIASIALGYYFNTKFVMDYQPPNGNPLTGPGSWSDYIRLMFVNPAASSAGRVHWPRRGEFVSSRSSSSSDRSSVPGCRRSFGRAR